MIRKFFLKILEKYASRWVVLGVDLLLVSISFLLAYFIRFSASLQFETGQLLKQLPVVIVISLISFILVGSYKGIVRHTGIGDAFNVFIGTTILSFLLGFVVLVSHIFSFNAIFTIPISIILIHYLVTVFVLVTSRFVFKAIFEILTFEMKSITNVLIFGAGDSGIITYAALNRDTRNNHEVAGFIDDNENKVGKKIDRVQVYSLEKITKEFIDKHYINEVVISTQSIQPDRLLEVTDHFLKYDIHVKIVPPLSKWIGGDLKVHQIEQVKIEDLLERIPISIDNPIVEKEVNNKVILVTGAAGSIGSEISRQLSIYSYKYLVLIDQAESDLFDLQQEFLQKGALNFTTIVADVRDVNRMEAIFKEFRPQKVFHAAAYKHVPLMEENPYEAVNVNVGGTKTIADLSLAYQVERFVMISTDKAVNPTNVMGATKRVAEMYVYCLSERSTKTKFTITRFGNVLGTNGSVIPLFKKQIKNGGPILVTHKDMTRYFMTIKEACSLVLEAGSMGEGGEIYIFDMGKSVKIVEVAKKMILLSGLKYPEDIGIQFSGLRPGEKLYEELLMAGEDIQKTYHKKIMIAKSQELDCEKTQRLIQKLCVQNKKLVSQDTVYILKKLVPEYKSNNSVYEVLDKVRDVVK
jgi:FlaA1/EpsC-like NDP-sugar epimerase